MKVVILKYKAGNVKSVYFALQRLGIEAVVSDEPEIVKTCDKLIIPGVGEASSAMEYLKEKQLDGLIAALKQPVLGICLGMQLMCSYSEEGHTDCLGIFNETVKKFTVTKDVKVPQVGWNTISNLSSPLLKNVSENAFMYFVHSYYVDLNDSAIAVTNYGVPFCSAMRRDNFFGVQFHPEKSSAEGQLILKNFIQL